MKSDRNMTNLVFDFDGTLHNTIKIYAPAYKVAYQYLTDKGLVEYREWSDEEIGRWLGYSSKEMWKAFMPLLPEFEKEICSGLIGSEMLRAIQSGEARLYEGVTKTLQALKEDGFRLIFLSNCKISYMEESIRKFELERYFSAFYCTEQYDFAPKNEIFKDIATSHPGQFIIIGDRAIDLQVAKTYCLPFIGCAYGYGGLAELRDADCIADNPYDLLQIIRKLEKSR